MADLAPQHDEGVFGFKCFLLPSGVDEFPCLEPEELELAMRETGRLGALRIVHAEHGLYVLEGKAVYLLNKDWVEVQAGDFMWLRAFCPQACYAGGPGRFRYLLYKDVNRHAKLPRQLV